MVLDPFRYNFHCHDGFLRESNMIINTFVLMDPVALMHIAGKTAWTAARIAAFFLRSI